MTDTFKVKMCVKNMKAMSKNLHVYINIQVRCNYQLIEQEKMDEESLICFLKV